MDRAMLSPGPISGNAAARPGSLSARRVLPLAIAIFAIAAATILGALAFEHIGGYLPCALCLEQRTPYYVGIPLAALAIAAIWIKAPRAAVTALFALVAALMLYNTGLAAYHSGVEWGFWPGPASCAPSIRIESAADMLNQLENAHAPSCTEAALRILGLSLAGWNVLISALLAALAIVAARKAWRAA
jgi:disulfide bond formation protein DsbB